MVMLFLGLCRAAGVPVLDAPRERQNQSRPVARFKHLSSATAAPISRAARMPSRGVASIPATPDQLDPIPSRASELLFGVTVEDIGALSEKDFPAVWDALGIIARARATSMKALRDMADQAAQRRASEPAEGDEGREAE